jgi:hypothetical protein
LHCAGPLSPGNEIYQVGAAVQIPTGGKKMVKDRRWRPKIPWLLKTWGVCGVVRRFRNRWAAIACGQSRAGGGETLIRRW